MENKLAIIIINYNNYSDTIECADKILHYAGPGVKLFILDNGSLNESMKKLTEWSVGKKGVRAFSSGDMFLRDYSSLDNDNQIILVASHENLGFARGCNLFLACVAKSFEYALLFNNDAFCLNDVPGIMIKYMDSNRDYGAATCRINNYGSSEVQQMGGALTWYGHFKRYGLKDIRNPQRLGFIDITFASGCILMLRCSLLKKFGILSERVFFGEEDVELAYRYKKFGVKMMSIFEAVAEHKGGSSQNTINRRNGLSAYATSMIARSITLKSQYGTMRWWLWLVLFNTAMFFNVAFRRNFGCRNAIYVYKTIYKYAIRLDFMDRNAYLRIISEF